MSFYSKRFAELQGDLGGYPDLVAVFGRLADFYTALAKRVYRQLLFLIRQRGMFLRVIVFVISWYIPVYFCLFSGGLCHLGFVSGQSFRL